MANHDDFEANPYASPETDLTNVDEPSIEGKVVYAEFGTRFVAAFVDGIIVLIIRSVLGIAIGGSMGITDRELAQGISELIGIVVGWLYCALQESSEAQATLGKRLMGVKVVDLNGQRISFARATGRHFGKFISIFTLFIGYLMQNFTKKRQALHDMMAGCLVIKR